LSNFYLFISELSQWNSLVCFPERKKAWIQKTGDLTAGERIALKEFAVIFQGAKNDLEAIFLFEKPGKVWRTLEGKVGKEQAKRIYSIFDLFRGKFERLWKIEKGRLGVIANKFRYMKPSFRQDLKTVEKLCGLSKRKSLQVELRLLMSSGSNDCQGWSLGDTVILECSKWNLNKMKELLNNIFLHECFHILFKRNRSIFNNFLMFVEKNEALVSNTALKEWKAKVVFEEVLVSSFLPEGYLGGKNLGVDSRKIAKKRLSKVNSDELTRLRFFSVLCLYDFAQEYVESGKVLDGVYFGKVTKCVKKFVKRGRKCVPTP